MYPLHFHQFSTNDWFSKSRDFQILNICSELQRAQNWIQKNRQDLVNTCYDRALELIDLTREDPRWRGVLRELSRAREFLAKLRIENMNHKHNAALLRNLILLDAKAEQLLNPNRKQTHDPT